MGPGGLLEDYRESLQYVSPGSWMLVIRTFRGFLFCVHRLQKRNDRFEVLGAGDVEALQCLHWFGTPEMPKV